MECPLITCNAENKAVVHTGDHDEVDSSSVLIVKSPFADGVGGQLDWAQRRAFYLCSQLFFMLHRNRAKSCSVTATLLAYPRSSPGHGLSRSQWATAGSTFTYGIEPCCGVSWRRRLCLASDKYFGSGIILSSKYVGTASIRGGRGGEEN